MTVKANNNRSHNRRKRRGTQLDTEDEFPTDVVSIIPLQSSEPSNSESPPLQIIPSLSIIQIMPAPLNPIARLPRQILICSIGNPGSYMNTRHSVGHYILQLLATSPFNNDFRYGGPVAQGPFSDDYRVTLFQSTSMMNISGKPVKKAWTEFLKSQPPPSQLAPENVSGGNASNKKSGGKGSPLLVVLHDELEKSLGQVKLKKSGSTGGHNGLSSIADMLSSKDFHRIGVGIGRPESREPRVVANYVLSKMTGREKEILQDRALPQVMDLIDTLGKG